MAKDTFESVFGEPGTNFSRDWAANHDEINAILERCRSRMQDALGSKAAVQVRPWIHKTDANGQRLEGKRIVFALPEGYEITVLTVYTRLEGYPVEVSVRGSEERPLTAVDAEDLEVKLSEAAKDESVRGVAEYVVSR